jgi:hypothetical protein
VEEARVELDKLEMEGNLIDKYIARFESLLKKAEILRNEVGVIIKFHDRLCKGLTASIYNKENWPDTLDKWQEAA